MITAINIKIEEQKAKVLGAHPEVHLISPCKIGDGIIQTSLKEQQILRDLFDSTELSTGFFIPSSGAGSRMFQFLFDFLEEPGEENRSKVEKFLNHISEFAFFQELPLETRKKLLSHDFDLDQFVSFLLHNGGMGYGESPKGMIPFHKNDPFILTPFQEHILQGSKVRNEKLSFHFTIQSRFEESIETAISYAQGMSGQKYEVSFSEQNPDTNAIAFNEEGKVFYTENGTVLERPAGHGALLENLNCMKSDLVFIKNIDNVQHFTKATQSIDTTKLLGGLILEFQKKAREICSNPSKEAFSKLNKKFQVYQPSEVENISTDEMIALLNRPLRVCGMVRNEGQPGGGPFWVESNGKITKQIVEKAQITMRGEQYRLMVQSTFFNPVLIAACFHDLDGNKLNLHDYKDESKFFIVRKKYKGQDIRFMELPGLWNGSMANWNSIFVEIPSTTFSPVKTVLDLLNESHCA
jgi:hypothetical protein